MPETTAFLRSSTTALSQAYDVALLDLDGVVYIGRNVVPNAAESLARARVDGMQLAFVTNNAARPPSAVAEHLSELGIPAEPAAVITSSQAAAHYLADRLPAGANVLVIGTVGLIEALRERGLNPVHTADDQPLAVVQGYSPSTDWALLAEGAIAINRGLPWVATNLDPTVPSPRGPLPGNGSLVAALRHATGVTPVATGKPDPTMHRETLERTGAKAPIVVGDRLDTDIQGARAVGCDSLLVLTGVTSPSDLLTARPDHRPDYVARDLRGLLVAHVGPTRSSDGWHCGPWLVTPELALHNAAGSDTARSGEPASPDVAAEDASNGEALDESDLQALRALSAAAWSARDDANPSSDPSDSWSRAVADGDARPAPVTVTPGDEASSATLARLGIAAA
jgi:glycerol 3-phosphatase-2